MANTKISALTPGAPAQSTDQIPAARFGANVKLLVSDIAPVQSVAGRIGAVVIAEADVTNLTADLAAKAPLASPALTGTPTGPTAAAATNTTQLATTAFVESEIPLRSAVLSVAGRTGVIVLAEADVTNLTADLAAKVNTTRTVNGHALSADVVVSASDLTTGTLPHAQLPALVSGDIPNNAANTSGTAAGLSANIAESLVTNLVTDLAAKQPLNPAINAQVASYTAVLADNGKLVTVNVASGNTFTVPLNATVAFPIGTTLTVLQLGLGQVTLTPAAGVTFVSAGSLLSRAQYSITSLTKIATDTWVAAGDLA